MVAGAIILMLSSLCDLLAGAGKKAVEPRPWLRNSHIVLLVLAATLLGHSAMDNWTRRTECEGKIKHVALRRGPMPSSVTRLVCSSGSGDSRTGCSLRLIGVGLEDGDKIVAIPDIVTCAAYSSGPVAQFRWPVWAGPWEEAEWTHHLSNPATEFGQLYEFGKIASQLQLVPYNLCWCSGSTQCDRPQGFNESAGLLFVDDMVEETFARCDMQTMFGYSEVAAACCLVMPFLGVKLILGLALLSSRIRRAHISGGMKKRAAIGGANTDEAHEIKRLRYCLAAALVLLAGAALVLAGALVYFFTRGSTSCPNGECSTPSSDL